MLSGNMLRHQFPNNWLQAHSANPCGIDAKNQRDKTDAKPELISRKPHAGDAK